MTFNIPTEEIKKFGFTNYDIELLKLILTSNELQDQINLVSIPGQLFDFGYFVKVIIENQNIRNKVIKILRNEVIDFPNFILDHMTFNPNSMHFKLNLFLLLIGTIQNNTVDPLYLQFLELDKNVNKSYHTLIDAFFEMAREQDFSLNGTFNLLSKSSVIERSGWVLTMKNLPHKESIAEHMYNMYLLGLLYLPQSINDVTYNKDDILTMVLLHDLAETITGDIPHPKKTIKYEIEEDLKAKAILCKLMYNGVPNASKLYDLWCEWYSNLTINAKIAHDLDVIQLNYQLLSYAHQDSLTFTDQDIIKWTARRPQTIVGQTIYQKVIFENEKFRERIGVISGKFSNNGINDKS